MEGLQSTSFLRSSCKFPAVAMLLNSENPEEGWWLSAISKSYHAWRHARVGTGSGSFIGFHGRQRGNGGWRNGPRETDRTAWCVCVLITDC